MNHAIITYSQRPSAHRVFSLSLSIDNHIGERAQFLPAASSQNFPLIPGGDRVHSFGHLFIRSETT